MRVGIHNIIKDILEIDAVEPNTDLRDYGMDSMNAMRILVSIEEELGIEFDDEDLEIENVSTISKIQKLLLEQYNIYTTEGIYGK